MACDPHNSHPMVTRHAAGVTKLVDYVHLSIAVAPPTLSPACSRTPLALLLNNTWDLVAQPPRANVVTSKWIFKCKLKVDDSLDWYKGCWVLWGFTQCPRVDYDETSTRRQVCHRSDYSDSSYLYGLDYALARRQGCLPPRHTL
jgi:hypothetical protein